MDNQIRVAKHVLMICTERYLQKLNGEEPEDSGLGVKWEGHLIYQHIYNAGSSNTKFIPVILANKDKKWIPTPLQSTSYYNAGATKGFEQLYNRLLDRPPAVRPPLGKIDSLPSRAVQTNVSVFLTSPIDLDLWNAANWRGTFYALYDDLPPQLGLAFRDEKLARKIFKGWQERYGSNDEYEELRVSIVEGDIDGEEPGYTVHIGPDLDNLVERYRAYGFRPNHDVMISVSRLNRMNPQPESTILQDFKREYRKYKTYFLVPGVLEEPSYNVRRIEGIGIWKRNVFFRRVEEISEHDIDCPVLGTGSVKRSRWR